MFGGNAKTHFQVLGRPSTTSGYMMSPFGDERWDLDDKEKLKKIFRNHEMIEKLENQKGGENFGENQILNHQNPNNKVVRPSQQQLKQRHHGYIHQSETAQGYMPKSEITQNYMSPQTYNPQPSFGPGSRMHIPNPNDKPRYETMYGYLSQNPVPKAVSTNSYNAPFEDDYETNARRISEANNYKYASRSEPQISDYNYWNYWEPNKNHDADYLQKRRNWPVWAPASTYRPFGPREPTPSPYFPPPEKTAYMPLR